VAVARLIFLTQRKQRFLFQGRRGFGRGMMEVLGDWFLLGEYGTKSLSSGC
jgi:hypothetical protein